MKFILFTDARCKIPFFFFFFIEFIITQNFTTFFLHNFHNYYCKNMQKVSSFHKIKILQVNYFFPSFL